MLGAPVRNEESYTGTEWDSGEAERRRFLSEEKQTTFRVKYILLLCINSAIYCHYNILALLYTAGRFFARIIRVAAVFEKTCNVIEIRLYKQTSRRPRQRRAGEIREMTDAISPPRYSFFYCSIIYVCTHARIKDRG